ncbi:hypothetical protein JQU17_19905 [Ponticoccus sp. SC2-23]|uniref:hypothetical protein n=1 Tax=Alexandriicola marinus TaxID=2081710 RepID=UPI000FD798AA|nr:hypothetical protein [Alexandriicola marinus]MBM1222479.1 hypothetical protein [Ponticoccus sp. SC6-9]MBM1226985.1 hypothetical protein [Ponticoccus sp. SC6-15]MBM1231406.1 hypothetical protein [Ponticoccus sp. SC6-38]MBM1235979.1 hypothetical protein [Ponticoccus sp. SC6-45]MBM1240429.1 hypothetical protein [Ponticoccus sp. SC6-49]MBM1244964.1 hypothetical protein [Ponticoccus sp. SC2-64]MBM1249453.1 hypothetical protein [Ponticoccus sp. SC6-42]MBM1253922.1 hypothetical protein [Pontico
MSARLGLCWLTHGAGPDFDPAAHAFAGLLRPGDHAVLVDLEAGDDTAARQARFFALAGFADGVQVTRVLGRGGAWEEAADIALQNLFSDPDPPELILFAAHGLRPDTAALLRARDRMGEEDRDLLRLRWTDHEAEDSLFSRLVHRDLLGRLRPSADGVPRLLWEMEARAQRPADHEEPLGALGREPAPGPRFAADLADLLDAEPDATDWAARRIPRWITATGRAARSAWIIAWPRLRRACPGLPETVPLPAPPLPAPARTGAAPVRLYRAGRHAHRTPFAYDVLAPLWEGRIAVQDHPDGADLVVFAHPDDPLTLDADTARALRDGARAMLFSEEPFWDSLFSPDPCAPHVTLPAGQLGEIRMAQVNHHTSPVFDWQHLPYYLLSQKGMIPRLAERFHRNAGLSPADWQAAFATRPARLAFMAERRPEHFHDIDLPRADLLGLCAWRTRLALAVTQGPVLRLGASWEGGPTRFEIDDWHDDKLTRMADHVQILSGLENTHQPAYLSEKFFDAFACGAVPLYLASPGHSVHRLGLPGAAWINLWGLGEEEARARVDDWQPNEETFAAYAAAQSGLAARFSDSAEIEVERGRLGRAVLREIDILIS